MFNKDRGDPSGSRREATGELAKVMGEVGTLLVEPLRVGIQARNRGAAAKLTCSGFRHRERLPKPLTYINVPRGALHLS
jgi:hypothetical protein